MKRIINVCICMLLLFGCFNSSVYAQQTRREPEEYYPSTSSAFFWDYPLDVLAAIGSHNQIVGELVDVNTTKQVITAQDATGLKAVMLSIIGDYETVVTDYEYRNNNATYTSHSIQIERDWAWICSLALFAVVIYCVFRGVVAIICNR